MAKITIVGQAVVVTSSLKLEDIKTVKKYRPEALVLKGGDDGKDPIFALSVGGREINNYGVSFSEETRDESRLATLTISTNYNGDDIEGYISDTIGTAIINLNKLESYIPEVLAEIEAEKIAIRENITVIS